MTTAIRRVMGEMASPMSTVLWWMQEDVSLMMVVQMQEVSRWVSTS